MGRRGGGGVKVPRGVSKRGGEGASWGVEREFQVSNKALKFCKALQIALVTWLPLPAQRSEELDEHALLPGMNWLWR